MAPTIQLNRSLPPVLCGVLSHVAGESTRLPATIVLFDINAKMLYLYFRVLVIPATRCMHFTRR